MTHSDAYGQLVGLAPCGDELAAFVEQTASPDIADLVMALARAAISVAAFVARGSLDPAVGADPDREIQKASDLFADEAFEDGLCRSTARAFVSGERDAPTPLRGEGRFLVALDPLDGSPQINADVTIGSIFSILDAPASRSPEADDFLQPGHRQRGAGMIVYGPHTALVFTVGSGTHLAILDPRVGAFRMTRTHILIPEGKAEFAINAANARHWPPPVRAYVEDCLMGEPGPRAKDFDMRWAGSLVADAYRVLRRGGAYLSPDDACAEHAEARLRLVSQANPIALLVEQAGGLAIDGVNRILDIAPSGLRAHVPLIFGSTDKIERIRRYYVDGYRSAARAPLFARRGLLRG